MRDKSNISIFPYHFWERLAIDYSVIYKFWYDWVIRLYLFVHSVADLFIDGVADLFVNSVAHLLIDSGALLLILLHVLGLALLFVDSVTLKIIPKL